MSFTNYVEDGNVTIVQGVNGIRFIRESWVAEKINKERREKEKTK